jgi:hypothetical protein
MVTEARLFDTSSQAQKAVRRLKAVGFLPEQVAITFHLVLVVAEGPMAALAKEILEDVAKEEC